MTPWQCKVFGEAVGDRYELNHNLHAWMMWHNAILSQTSKKPPPLEDFMLSSSKKKNRNIIDEAGIKARLAAYKRRYELEHGQDSSRRTADR